ncbi:histidine phosphatase family protein [Dactylosporangium sp. CA-233914]|uniref:histidine phosphatase family protein n=1 Tax=Dactylosporangium sp. CA-233914 TaxID=3239934 RepID=UPI003D9110D8
MNGDPSRPVMLLLVRHGETTWNRESRFQGQQDPPLSALGHRQASALADRLSGARFDAGYTSDLRRARQTARPVAGRTGVEFVPEPLVREVGMGAWEGLTTAEVERAHGPLWKQWRVRPRWDLPPEGEGSAALALRADAMLRRCATGHPGQRVVCVSHGGFIQAVLSRALSCQPCGPYPFQVHNASITTLRHERGTWWVEGVNDHAHLLTPAVDAR